MEEIHMGNLVAENCGQFGLGFDEVQHRGADVDMATKDGPGIGVGRLYHMECPVDVLATRMGRDPCADKAHIV